MDCLARLAEELKARRPAALLTVLAAPPGFPLQPGFKLLVGPQGILAGRVPGPGLAAALVAEARAALAKERPGARDLELAGVAVRVYVEPYLPPPVLVVVGAGHVAQPLALMGKTAGFDVTVLDDRPEYADPARFPTADRVFCAPFSEGLEQLDLGPAHYVVLVTRGHRYDMHCLRHVLERPVAYVGMIGSRNRVRTVFAQLQQEYGVDPALLGRVYSPVGLDIGARTPAEIAVAVVAELVKVRRGGSGESLSRLNRARVHDDRARGR